jgi:anti-sigma regulatory factor (Ser/Thr protein kinase)
MSHGQSRVPVLQKGWRGGQEPSPGRLPEMLLSSAVLPAARWVCRQIVCCQLDTALASKAAREFTGQILRGWGLLALAEDATVIVSELVTNALRHGGCHKISSAHDCVELILWRQSGQVVCAVTDPGAEAPVMVQPDPFAEAGRGLHVVQALSATWGWTRLGGRRKAVWAALAVPGEDSGQGWRRPA